jgi:hypothetical protein
MDDKESQLILLRQEQADLLVAMIKPFRRTMLICGHTNEEVDAVVEVYSATFWEQAELSHQLCRNALNLSEPMKFSDMYN